MTDNEQKSKQGQQKVSDGLAEQAEVSSRQNPDQSEVESAKDKRAQGEIEATEATQQKKSA
ncbi:hypothetical protein HNQ77_001039 [Silvibacterium bohemicum]|uniref:Uncharacterized protein n=1 Tax=Silvibacterium bohemicum TaxID=1577686 RepID=A0A841JRQ8_9BACT|nr:hypothetical protein [Silvibacterium bohemicum]MBB6143095.1 hypothetical protein [Silvibacterium bohemicum]